MHRCVIQYYDSGCKEPVGYSAAVFFKNQEIWYKHGLTNSLDPMFGQSLVLNNSLTEILNLGIKKLQVEVNSQPLIDAFYSEPPDSPLAHEARFHLKQARNKFQTLQEYKLTFREDPLILARARNYLIKDALQYTESTYNTKLNQLTAFAKA